MISETQDLPPALPGFEHVNRYWDVRMNLPAAKILPGEFYVSRNGEMIVTVLGSCVSACIRDRQLGIGGMNHFMLPQKGTHSTEVWGAAVSSASRYGNWAMEFLINEILKLGGTRRNLEIKIFGGGNVLNGVSDVGERNISFVRQYLFDENFTIAAEDLGGIYPRKVLFFPDTGAVKVRKLRDISNDTLIRREQEYSRKLVQKPDVSGDVELF